MAVFDLSLYLVTDTSFLHGRNLIDVVREAIAGGVTMVQLREKNATSRVFYEQALQLKKITKDAQIPLIINDRLDIALAVDADGLHIGQGDLPFSIAREIFGKNKIIGLSVESIEEAREANVLDVDYIGISPVFSTATKTDTKKPFGLEGISKVASFIRHPMVGIGGINLSNAHQIIKAGAQGIAVVSAILDSPNPQNEAKQLRQIMNI